MNVWFLGARSLPTLSGSHFYWCDGCTAHIEPISAVCVNSYQQFLDFRILLLSFEKLKCRSLSSCDLVTFELKYVCRCYAVISNFYLPLQYSCCWEEITKHKVNIFCPQFWQSKCATSSLNWCHPLPYWNCSCWANLSQYNMITTCCLSGGECFRPHCCYVQLATSVFSAKSRQCAKTVDQHLTLVKPASISMYKCLYQDYK